MMIVYRPVEVEVEDIKLPGLSPLIKMGGGLRPRSETGETRESREDDQSEQSERPREK